MHKDTQISAFVSCSTKEQLERYVRATGVEMNYLVEQDLQHYLAAFEQLPADVVVHPKLLVTSDSGKAVLRQLRTGKPARALRALMHGGN